MTALAPLPPQPTEPARDEVELGAELDNLRRKADEQSALLRKHQAAVTQLADSVAALVALGKQRNRWINLNSFVAYVLFTMLLGGAMFVLYRSRVGELEARRAQAVAERDHAKSAAHAAPHDDVAAAALYALVKAGDDAGLLAREAELATAPLTVTERAMLADAIAAAKARAGQGGGGGGGGGASTGAVDDGLVAWKAGRWAEAAPALERALLDAPPARAAQLHYHLGVARWKLGEHAAAADQLEQALAGKLDASAVDARYLYAASLDRLGSGARARAEYDRFATAHPKSPLAVYARRRSAALARKARAAAAPAPAPEAADDTAPTGEATPPSAPPAAPATDEKPSATVPSLPPAELGGRPGGSPPAP
jgi:hypothetical protein